MKKFLVVWGLTMLSPQIGEAQAQLKGFSYDKRTAPTGQEWQNPEAYALGKEQPRATFYSFGSVEQALGVLPEHSSYHQNLDGKWRFRWVGNPEERTKNFYERQFDDSGWDEVSVPMSWNIYGIQKDGSQKYGTPIYLNQRVPFYHEVKVDDWRGGVMRTPPKDHTMYKHRNEVGSYRRSFKVDESWAGQAVYINFDGVDSFFYLWINGQYVGFSKNSRNKASFDISPYLVPGENVIAVEVYRNSDGTFLESQDMFRLPGIFRSVYLTAKPKVQIQDLQIIPDLDEKYENGSLAIRADLSNLTKKRSKGMSLRYSLYSLPLYQDKGAVKVGESTLSTAFDLERGGKNTIHTSIQVAKPKLWSAEAPHRYVLVAELLDKGGKVVETISSYTGIRKVEVKDVPAEQDEFGLAGRYFLINGKPVKLKGVNRHETHPATGHVITRQMMEEELWLMKRANINHVRNSHYPTDPYFYYLCDKYGIYLEDEANIESHQYYYGKESLSHVKEWDIQTTNRMMEMVYADINHPSIVIWSLGNEAGPGDNFKRSYAAAKEVDPSRPIQYERNNDIVDIGSNQYPSIPWVQEAVKGKYKIKYPFHISEYAHSMGNAVGGLEDYWKAIESTNFFCGAAIWDWVDQAMYNYLPDGKQYFAYGGDFGDTPNDGMFVMNGIIFADRKPKPQYYEVKKVYQYVDFGDKALRKEGKFEVFNKNYYTSLNAQEHILVVELLRDGRVVATKELACPTIAPRSRAIVSADLPELTGALAPESEYFVRFKLRSKQALPWAEAGHVMAEEQVLLASAKPEALTAKGMTAAKLKLDLPSGKKEQNTLVEIKGDKFSVQFDQVQGTIHSYSYKGQTLIKAGQGPKLDAFRAACDNDNWAYEAWGKNGLHNLKHKAIASNGYVRPDGAAVMFYLVESQAPNAAKIGRKNRWASESSGKYYIEELLDQPMGEGDFKITTAQTWVVYPDGSVELQANIVTNKPKLALGRLGYEVVIPKEYQQYSYYGRGPINNYSDRKASQFVGLYESTVADQFVHFPKPQTMGNREDVRWVSLRNASGAGLVFQAAKTMSASALPWSAKELLLAPHPHELPPAGDTHLHLDASVTGLGGNSCGQGAPLEHCRSLGHQQRFGFVMRPLEAGQEVKPVALVSEVAPIISRDSRGFVSISAQEGEKILYSINKAKPQVYSGTPFELREAAQITTWTERNPLIRVKQSFPKVETVPLEVLYASSQESGGGDAKHLVDGSNETIWHTMYSVTVAQYPHWIDFDAGREQLIKGFSYTPRSGSDNGDIKDFSFSISADGKTWTEVHKGSFPHSKNVQRITLPSAVKARYVRFTGLSSQNGADYAAGAEFNLIVD